MSPESLLSGKRIQELLVELGRRLDTQGIEARMFVVGGAAMALAFDRERVTRDIDAVFAPKSEVYRIAGLMADDLDLPPDWLNDAVKGLLPDRAPLTEGSTSFSTTGLHVGVASAEFLFAMKAQAARQEADGGDLLALAEQLDLRSVTDALALLERFYDPTRLSPKSSLMIEDVIEGRLRRLDEGKRTG